MKLYDWKKRLLEEFVWMKRWDDAEIIMDYYLKEARKEQKKVRGTKKEHLLWWREINTNDKSKLIEKMFNSLKVMKND